MKRLLFRLWTDDEGTTAVEYSVMLAMILIVIIGAITSFGGAGNGMFGRIDSQMRNHGIQ
jgi:Flp pilus assembly pilin Flp